MLTRKSRLLWMLASALALASCDEDRVSDPPPASFAPVPYDVAKRPKPIPSAGPISEQARRIFSGFHGRWNNSEVRYIGKIDVGTDYFEIYHFAFVNPQSNHGTRLIALLWNGKEFAGRYAINGHGSATEAVVTALDRSTIIFTCDDPPPYWVTKIAISGRSLPKKLRLCGNEASLETDGI